MVQGRYAVDCGPRWKNERGDRLTLPHDVVEPRTLVHERECLLDQRLEQLGAFVQCAPHARRADDRQPVPGEQHLRL